MAAAADDVLVLVDATRGVVLVDPDPIYLAQYTAEHDRVAPKNRIYLDDAHLPALTLDGRVVTVATLTDVGIEGALASGPDALYHRLPLTFDPDAVRRHLAQVEMVAAGKPLLVPYNPSVPLRPIVEAASTADITLVVPAAEGGSFADASAIADLLTELDLAQTECAEADVLSGLPRLAAEVSVVAGGDRPSREEMAAHVEAAAGAGVTRLLCSGDLSAGSIESLADLIAAASVSLMPVMLHLDETDPLDGETGDRAVIHLLIGAGVTGFLVQPDRTQSTKAAIRGASASECRGELAEWIAERVTHVG
jgi:hypothetical protein